MKSTSARRQIGQMISFLTGGILLLSFGCGAPTVEPEKARQTEAELKKRLQECETELAEARKALQSVRQGSPELKEADWKAARLAAEVFVQAVNSRDAAAANAACTRQFRDEHGGTNAVNVFGNGRFRGEAKGYKCSLLRRLEAVPGKGEVLGRGELFYRDVLKKDSSYILRIVKEGDSWRVASFTAVER